MRLTYAVNNEFLQEINLLNFTYRNMKFHDCAHWIAHAGHATIKELRALFAGQFNLKLFNLNNSTLKFDPLQIDRLFIRNNCIDK